MLAVAVCLRAAGAQTGSSEGFEALLKQGFELHKQARFAEALAVLERARRLEPADYFANLLLGVDLLRLGRPAEAVTRLRAASRANPEDETAEDYLGEAEAGLGHYALAVEAYQLANQRGKGSEEALKAWAGFALERFHDIGAGLRASEPGMAAARRLATATAGGGKAVCAGPIAGLERKLTLAVEAAAAADAGYQLSVCYALEAGKAAEQLQVSAADPAGVQRLRGDVLLRLKEDAAGAAAEYRAALQLRPGDPTLLERLAEAQLAAGDGEGARQSAQAALGADPHRREALRTLASLAMGNRDYEQALPWLRQLAREAPGDRSVQVELSRALAQTGEAAEALHWLVPALAAGYPDEKGALHALVARQLHKLGRDAEAAKAEAEARRLSDAFQAKAAQPEHEKPDAHQ